MGWCELAPAHSWAESLPPAWIWAVGHRLLVQDGISAFAAGCWDGSLGSSVMEAMLGAHYEYTMSQLF